MVHDYNTRGRKQELVINMNHDSQMKDMENNKLCCINFLKGKILNLKQMVVKNFQNDNEKLRQKCEQLGRHCAKYKSDHIALAYMVVVTM